MLRRLFAVLLAIVILIILVGFMLPRTITIERDRTIDQPREVIFEVLQDFRHFSAWSPWHAANPDAGYRIEGRPAGVGAALAWSDEGGSGAGRLTIVATDPPRRIDMQMELGESENLSYFLIEPDGLGQRVTWGLQVEFNTFDLTGRYIGLLLPAMIGRSYNEGLERLEAYLAETPGRVPEPPADFIDDTFPGS